MTARIDTSDFTAAIRGLGRASTRLQKELVKNLHEAGPPIVADMKGAASTKIQRRGASSIDMRRYATGIELIGGSRGGLNAVLFPGSEYGGGKSKKVTYATRSRAGKAYAVKRRTTMQFGPHLGDQGHYFWPTMRVWLPKLEKIQIETVERVMGGGR